MQRRTFIVAALAAGAPPFGASAQTAPARPAPPPPITPENELERVFLAALDDPEMRPEFRRLLMTSPVVLAMANNSPDSPPLELTIGDLRTAAIFTSPTRQNAVLGPASARRALSGRQALTLLRGKRVVVNFMHTPMLTLDPPDVAQYLAQ